MKPSIFGYQAPTTLEDAISLLAGDADAVVLAGGQTLLPAMNFRAASACRTRSFSQLGSVQSVS